MRQTGLRKKANGNEQKLRYVMKRDTLKFIITDSAIESIDMA